MPRGRRATTANCVPWELGAGRAGHQGCCQQMVQLRAGITHPVSLPCLGSQHWFVIAGAAEGIFLVFDTCQSSDLTFQCQNTPALGRAMSKGAGFNGNLARIGTQGCSGGSRDVFRVWGCWTKGRSAPLPPLFGDNPPAWSLLSSELIPALVFATAVQRTQPELVLLGTGVLLFVNKRF